MVNSWQLHVSAFNGHHQIALKCMLHDMVKKISSSIVKYFVYRIAT